MRNRFDRELKRLNQELIEMGTLCESAISMAIQELLENGDVNLSENVLETEKEINGKERDIERFCMSLLLRQQPVAKDLRVISSALKMISDMERIGDQATDISEIVRYLKGHDEINKLHIKNMTVAVIKMVTESIESFVEKDLELAQSVIEYDDVVDDLFDEIKSEIVDLIGKNQNGEYCIDLLMIAKYLERIADHATNIAGWVIFSITGKHGLSGTAKKQ